METLRFSCKTTKTFGMVISDFKFINKIGSIPWFNCFGGIPVAFIIHHVHSSDIASLFEIGAITVSGLPQNFFTHPSTCSFLSSINFLTYVSISIVDHADLVDVS